MNNEDLPLVSVIVRSIDRPELQTALDSVAAQTYPHLEVVLINARGSDHRHMDAHCGVHPLRVIGTGEPLHRSRAANLGLEAACGELLIFLDDDDWFLPEHISGLVAALHKHTEVGAAYAVVECLRSGEDGSWERVHLFNQPFDRVRLLIENYIPMHAILFRRTLLEQGCRIDESLDVYEDWDFWIQLSRQADFVFVDQQSAIYRIGGDSGFGVAGNDEAVVSGLKTLFHKWRTQWSDDELLAITRYAKYRSTYYDLLKLYDGQNYELAERQALLDAEREALLTARDEIQTSRHENESLKTALRSRDRNIRRFERQTDLLNRQISAQAAQIQSMLQSRSWRLTRPLRDGLDRLRRVRWVVRHYSKAALNKWRVQGFFKMCAHALTVIRRRSRERNEPLVGRVEKQKIIWRLETEIQPISLPRPAQPLVSVIVLSNNDILPLFSCLKSIAIHAADIVCEVICVDNDSSSECKRMLASVDGVRIVAMEARSSREAAWNAGARQARGEFLVFLNGSELVTENYLSRLLSVRTRFPHAGLVGPCLLDPDNTLRSAGGIVWREGDFVICGQGGDADMPEYGYVRRVDFCPGTGFLIRRDLFGSFGGFDENGTSSVLNNIDLAFRVRQTGAHVYLQPAATLVDFSLTGKDRIATTDGTGEESAAAVFRRRWSDALSAQPDAALGVRMARDAGARQHVLVVDWLMLTPDQDSGSLRMFTLLEELVRLDIKVVFAVRRQDEKRRPYLEQLQQIGVEVLYPPYVQDVEEYLQRHGAEFDVVMLSRLGVAEHLCDTVREYAPQALLVFDTVDLHFLRERRMAEHEGNAQQVAATQSRKDTEVGVMRKADITVVVSPYEKVLLEQEFPDIQVEVVSNIHDIYGSAAGFGEREGFLFIGGFDHLPNVDAVTYYVREILPRVVDELGPVKTWIVGSNPTAEVLALASDNVIIEGFVEDVSSHFARARMSIAPLRYGAGVKGKVNMSMAYGLPAVVTPIAAEGMSLVHEFDAMVGEDADAFARCMVRLYRDEQLWNALSENGIVNVETHFSRAAARRELQKILLVDAV